MADIYTMTPGSAVAEQLQQILQRRRDTERQLMLDRLGMEKTRHDMENDDAQLELQRQQEARMGRQTNASIAQTEALTAGTKEDTTQDQIESLGHEKRDVSGLEQTNPDLLKALQQRALVEEGDPTFEYEGPGPEASPRDEVGAIDRALKAGPMNFIGSKEFQKDETDSKRIKSAIPEVKGATDALTAQMIMQAAGATPSTTGMPNQTRVFGPTGNLTQTIGSRVGDDAVVRPFPPVQPQPNASNAVATWNLINPATGATTQVSTNNEGLQPYIASGWRVEGKVGTATTPNLEPTKQRAVSSYVGALRMPRGVDKANTIAAAKQGIIATAQLSQPHKLALDADLTSAEQAFEQGKQLPDINSLMALLDQDIASGQLPQMTAAEREEYQSTLNLIISNLRTQ
jgi:hypothetical protein